MQQTCPSWANICIKTVERGPKGKHARGAMGDTLVCLRERPVALFVCSFPLLCFRQQMRPSTCSGAASRTTSEGWTRALRCGWPPGARAWTCSRAKCAPLTFATASPRISMLIELRAQILYYFAFNMKIKFLACAERERRTFWCSLWNCGKDDRVNLDNICNIYFYCDVKNISYYLKASRLLMMKIKIFWQWEKRLHFILIDPYNLLYCIVLVTL